MIRSPRRWRKRGRSHSGGEVSVRGSDGAAQTEADEDRQVDPGNLPARPQSGDELRRVCIQTQSVSCGRQRAAEGSFCMLNKVVLTGRLSKEPTLKISAKEVPVCRFSVAVEQRGKERKTDFFPVVCFYGTAEFVARHFKKGQGITLCGSLQNRDWEDEEGVRHHVTEVLAQEAHWGAEGMES